jgi:hypothetical protein
MSLSTCDTIVTSKLKSDSTVALVGANGAFFASWKLGPVWTMNFARGVRPIAFEQNTDGSTRRMFVQLSDFHGFAVVDFAERKEVRRIALPNVPLAQRHLQGLQGSPSHGLGIAPGGQTLWVNSKMNSYSLPDLSLLGGYKWVITPIG